MRLRILVVVLMLLMPLKAQAAITWDFGAISGTIQNVVTNVKTAIDTAKGTVLEWKFIQHLGSCISTVAEFFQNVRNEYDRIRNMYLKWREDIVNFQKSIKDFYNSTMDVYKAALDTAENISEIATRVQVYLNESKDLIQYIGATVTKCVDNTVELVKFKKHFNEQKEELNQTLEFHRAEKAALEQELAALEANPNSDSNEITNRIRDTRERIYILDGQINNFLGTLDDIDNQIVNFIMSQKGLVYECIDDVRMIRGRVDRLLCNIKNTEIKGFESKINQIGNSINNWSNSILQLNNTTQDLKNDFTEGCGDVDMVLDSCYLCDLDRTNNKEACNKCNICKPTQGETLSYAPLPSGDDKCEEKIREILGAPGAESCLSYKNTCEEQISKGNPYSNTCEISCSPLCGTIDPGSQTCCNIYNSKCSAGKENYCDKYRENCNSGQGGGQISFNYSVSTSSATAYAFSINNLGDAKSGNDEYGNLIIPDNMAACCQDDSSDALKDGEMYKCINRFITAAYTEVGTEISEDDKIFFQCLRRTINRDKDFKDIRDKTGFTDLKDFDPQVRSSDNKAAAMFLEEAYAEYLAGAYLDALRSYQDSLEYANEIAKENNSSYKDIGSNWVAVGNMSLKVNNRINEIGKIWAREQLIRAVNKARNYKISSKEKTDAK